MALGKNLVHHNHASKYVEVQYHFVRDCVTKGKLSLEKVATANNVVYHPLVVSVARSLFLLFCIFLRIRPLQESVKYGHIMAIFTLSIWIDHICNNQEGICPSLH